MKVVVLGDTCVGKSSILTRISSDEFSPDKMRSTTAAAFFSYESSDPKDPEIYFCDTAGMEKYRSMNYSYYRDAACALLVFDITRKETFDHAITTWKTDFLSLAPTSFVFLVGNKCDMTEERVISEEQARNWANAHCINYFETSALNGEGIKEMVDGLLKMLPENPNLSEDVVIESDDRNKCC